MKQEKTFHTDTIWFYQVLPELCRYFTAGNIEITSGEGDISVTGAIASSSQSGIAGNVTLDAAGSVNILGIEAGGDTSGGNISIISDRENSVNALETLTTSSENGSGGNVTLAGIAASGRQQGGNATISTRA